MQAWYLLYCKGRREKTVQQSFEHRQITCYVPEIEIEAIIAGKKQRKMVPLFPNYVFVRFDPHISGYGEITRVPNVASIVRTNGELAPVELSLVVGLREALKRRTEPEVDLPKKGDKVVITDGAFANLEAVFEEPDGEKRSILLVKMLGEMQKMNVDNLGFRRL
ncbi:transcription/translation regulatory transformer protein RfaH [Ferrimonas lipolytica]|uniref:Transcription/translation regulatory transformer protein RfaH n=1 Tax=Ferrimonas lipolytica TaxID=2724191 RepID=A0A6H1UF68_9GAMM|nr:transcription/translation regulatory transformer protein RfaH [Ferrimonas lipolytica]QIZ77468.1 transcription/translation regulatory transformer protein RfaH [Ferrimonas lipolytica]